MYRTSGLYSDQDADRTRRQIEAHANPFGALPKQIRGKTNPRVAKDTEQPKKAGLRHFTCTAAADPKASASTSILALSVLTRLLMTLTLYSIV